MNQLKNTKILLDQCFNWGVSANYAKGIIDLALNVGILTQKEWDSYSEKINNELVY